MIDWQFNAEWDVTFFAFGFVGVVGFLWFIASELREIKKLLEDRTSPQADSLERQRTPEPEIFVE